LDQVAGRRTKFLPRAATGHYLNCVPRGGGEGAGTRQNRLDADNCLG